MKIIRIRESDFMSGVRFLLLMPALLFILNPVIGQSKIFKELKDSYSLSAELYFYASTLRMINIENNPDFDEMIQDIDKMTFYQINDPEREDIEILAKNLIDQEKFEEMVTIDGKKEFIQVLGREDEFIALILDNNVLMAANLQGKIGVHKIPELMNMFNSGNFLNVFEVGKKEREEHQNN